MLAALALLLMAASPVAAAPPGLPSFFYGRVLVAGRKAPVGASVQAYVGGQPANSAPVKYDERGDSVYALGIRADDPDTPGIEGGRPGDAVTFVVELPAGGSEAMSQTSVWRGGTVERLDLFSEVRLGLPLIILLR
jgi:hypothetical protein